MHSQSQIQMQKKNAYTKFLKLILLAKTMNKIIIANAWKQMIISIKIIVKIYNTPHKKRMIINLHSIYILFISIGKLLLKL